MKKLFFFLSIVAALSSQAQIKISSMVTASGSNGSSVWVPVLEGGINKKMLGAKFMYDSLLMQSKYGTDTMRIRINAALAALSGATSATDSLYILTSISDSLNANKKRLLGYLVNTPTITSISNYTNTGLTSPSVSGGRVRLTASANTFGAHLAYNYYSLLERWYQKIPFKIIATATNGGIGIGMQSANNISLDKSNVYGYIKKTSTDTKMYIVSGYTGYGIFPIDSLTIPNASFQNSDSCVMEFERVVDTMYLKFKNFTQNTNYALKAPLTDVTAPNTGQYAMFDIGGTYDVYGHTISSNEVVGAQLGLIGDSKTAAFGTGISNGRYRYGELLGNNFPHVVITGGPADKTTEVLLRIPELIALGFKQSILSPGCNDIRGGMLEVEYEYNYDSITRALSAAGVQVFHEYYYEGAESFQPTQVAWLQATYPNNYINTYDELKNTSGTVINSHPSDLGHQIIAKTTIQSYKLHSAVNAPVVTYQLPQKIHADTKVDLAQYHLWLKTATKTTEDTAKTTQLWIGDTINRNIFKWTYPGLFNSTYNGQANAAVVISKTKRNNNENADLLSMVTADAPTKNGWHFQNLTGVAGYVIPRMITYGLADPGYVHLAFCKYSGMNWQVANYDSADLAGKIATYQPINPAYSAYSFFNGGNYLLDILGSGRGTITGNDWRYAGNYAANYTNRSLVDKNYVDSIIAVVATGIHIGNSDLTQTTASRLYKIGYTSSSGDRYLNFGTYSEKVNFMLHTNKTDGAGDVQIFSADSVQSSQITATWNAKNNRFYQLFQGASKSSGISHYLDSLTIVYTGATKLRYLFGKDTFSIKGQFPISSSSADSVLVKDNNGIFKLRAQSNIGSGYTAAQIDSIARLAIGDSTNPLYITQSIGANRIFFKANDSLMKFHSIEADSNITIVARIDVNGDTVWKIKAKKSIDSLRMISDSVMRVYNNAGYTYDLSIPGKANGAGGSGGTQTIVDTSRSVHAIGALYITLDGSNVFESNGIEHNIGAFENTPIHLKVNNKIVQNLMPTTGNAIFQDGGTFTDDGSRVQTTSISFGYAAKTAAYTLTAADYLINNTSGTHNTTLPTAVGCAGRQYVITNSGAGVVTLATTSSQTFANVTATPTTLTLNQYSTVTVVSNGANWLRITSL